MKKIIINFKNWPSIASEHSFEMSDEIDLNNYEYIWFKSKNLVQMLYNIYKKDFYQGSRIYLHKPNNHYILKETGLYDCFNGPKILWKTFKEQICPLLLYTFEINNENEIIIYPINILKNNEIFRENRNKILEV